MSEAIPNDAAAIHERYAPPVPDAVKRQRAEVDAMMRGGDPAQPAPATPAGGQVVPGTPVEGGEPLTEADAGGQGSQPPPARAPQVEPPADAPESGDAPDRDSNSGIESLRRQLAAAEQEARTWKGRHSKTAEEQKALQDRVSDLERRLKEASAKPPPKDVDAPSAEEVETYGSDLLDVTRRFALADLRERLDAALGPVLERLDALEAGVGSVQARSAKTEWEKFLERLEKRVPDWKTVDESTAFGAWLDEEDPLFGVPRRNGLVAATEKLDDVRVARVFEAFQNQTGTRSGGSRGTKPADQPAAGTGAKTTSAQPAEEDTRPTLEDLAAPGSPTSSQPSVSPTGGPGEKKVWRISEVNAYFRARSKGDHPHSHDPRAARLMDEEINRANLEGRIDHTR